MARKLLIFIALIIAAFPHLGFTRSIDVTVTTVLALFLAAVLLFSKRPKIIPSQKTDPYPEAKPSPFVPSMHELPITHPKEESFSPAINMQTGDAHVSPKVSIPSPVQTPLRKRVRLAQPIVIEENIVAPVQVESASLNTMRRPRKQTKRLTLSEEEQVPPANIPFPVADDTFKEAQTEMRP